MAAGRREVDSPVSTPSAESLAMMKVPDDRMDDGREGNAGMSGEVARSRLRDV
jgi:hypothetical protein